MQGPGTGDGGWRRDYDGDMGATPTVTGRRYAIVGTAGHIDHGKSTLVRALTGIDPDRLPEEKARGMTIELGFAHLELGDVQLGIVDVPGHERFVRTMVAGAAGVDLAMLLVAADDGVMPQTLEHVEILDLLGVERGVVVISKADLATADRIAEVREKIGEATRGTLLRAWPIVAVSAGRGAGLDELRQVLREIALGVADGRESELFRMSIDRVFSVKGRGTVVTGSVLRGVAQVGQTLTVAPKGVACRVREVQTHGVTAASASGGQRAALNLTGIERETIERGDELGTPGSLAGTRYVDGRVRLTGRRADGLASHRRVRVSLGTREEIAVLVCLDDTTIEPGETKLAQLRFAGPVVAGYGQRFIIRDENAQGTLGGGSVLRAVSQRTKPSAEITAALRRLESADARDRVDEVVRSAGFVGMRPELMATLAGVEPSEVAAHLEAMRRGGALLRMGAAEVHAETVAALRRRAMEYLRRHHVRQRVEPGVGQDRFVGWLERRSAAGAGAAVFAAMRAAGEIEVRGPYVARRDFRPALSAEDSSAIERLVAELKLAGLDPAEWSKLRSVAGVSKQRAAVMLELARSEPRLVQVGPTLFVEAGALARLKETVAGLGQDGRAFKLAEVRDKLDLSRRSVLPLLEYLDRVGFTRRVGDERVLGTGA